MLKGSKPTQGVGSGTRRVICLTLALALCFALAACGAQSPEEQILGEWSTADREIVWIFYEGGSMVGGSDGEYEDARWSINEDTLRITASYETVVFDYSLDGNKLSLYEGGQLTGELYRLTSNAESNNNSPQGLQEQLENSSVYAEAVASFEADGLSSITFSHTQDGENGNIELVYNATYTVHHEYANENNVYEVVFGYSDLSGDFYPESNLLRETYYSDWNLLGVWTGEDTFDTATITITEMGEDYIDLSYDYYEGGYNGEGEASGGGRYYFKPADRPIGNFPPSVDVDGVFNMYLHPETGVSTGVVYGINGIQLER